MSTSSPAPTTLYEYYTGAALPDHDPQVLVDVLGNDPDDRACRTKLCAEPVGDLERLFTEWDRWGWHRVTAYGDLKAPLKGVADALGWKRYVASMPLFTEYALVKSLSASARRSLASSTVRIPFSTSLSNAGSL